MVRDGGAWFGHNSRDGTRAEIAKKYQKPAKVGNCRSFCA